VFGDPIFKKTITVILNNVWVPGGEGAVRRQKFQVVMQWKNSVIHDYYYSEVIEIKNMTYRYKKWNKKKNTAETCAFAGIALTMGHAVVQLVEALRYKPEGRGFDTQRCHWHSPSAALWPWIRLSLYQKRLPVIFPGGKCSWCLGLTTLPSSCAGCLEIWEPQTPGTLRSCPGQYNDCFTFLLLKVGTNFTFLLTYTFLILRTLSPDSVIINLHFFLSLSYFFLLVAGTVGKSKSSCAFSHMPYFSDVEIRGTFGFLNWILWDTRTDLFITHKTGEKPATHCPELLHCSVQCLQLYIYIYVYVCRGAQVVMATAFFTVAPNICGSSVGTCFMYRFWRLEFWDGS
jgi:hypothetical protein